MYILLVLCKGLDRSKVRFTKEAKMRVHLTKVSTNIKTGPMPVSTTEKASCPKSCSLKGSGCYAESGPLGIHWNAVSNASRGSDWDSFCNDISKLPKGIMWRHNQAGDLPGLYNDNLDAEMLVQLVNANIGKKGFTYTHYPVLDNSWNAELIRDANKAGFTINLSAESYQEADALADLRIGPVVTIQSEDMPKTTYTPKGRKVITCPATYMDNVSCYTCKLCQKWKAPKGVKFSNAHGERPIIAFPVHGTSKKKANKVFMMKSV